MRVVNRPTVGAFCDNTMPVHRGKHPTLAAAALKVDPARCLVVEDTVTGVTAGVAAGATVVGYSPSSVGHSSPAALRAAGAVQVIADMALLPALLA